MVRWGRVDTLKERQYYGKAGKVGEIRQRVHTKKESKHSYSTKRLNSCVNSHYLFLIHIID